jgi:hypothetical protein
VGIVSSGLITRRSEAAEHLLKMHYDCVILDEAHRARRRNLGENRDAEQADPNNLLKFMYQIAVRTRSLLLATATPVQLRPVEVWDLLDILSRGDESVLGNLFSRWRRSGEALNLVMGSSGSEVNEDLVWEWVRNPLPPKSEHRDFEILRRRLNVEDDEALVSGDAFTRLREPDRARLLQLFPRFVHDHNPFIRRIVRLMLGTDAASEGLNLQRLARLINLDLPWNPTRLEQRKGRIQRIGQIHNTVHIYNMRYKDSVEDRVHELLSNRLQDIYSLFGQIPDVLEDAWVAMASGEKEQAKKIIDAVPQSHPFEIRYADVEKIDWESCRKVLDRLEKKRILKKCW